MRVTRSYSVDVVVPCFNEESVLASSAETILNHLRRLRADPGLALGTLRIILVDDGSKDATWETIEGLARRTPEVVGVKLSRNFGHQYALLAGLSHSTAEATISLDADLQDDIAVVADMLRAYEGGSDIALGVRSDRRTDSAYKRLSARLYYRLLKRLGSPIVENHADFRLLSRRAREALLAHEEVNVFLRGLVTTVGFPVTLVPYTRRAREDGETKYTLGKMLGLALDGITSFSATPLRMIAVLGGAVFVISGLIGLYVICQRLISPSSVVPGWASTLLPLLFLGGLQILSIGVLGEYIGRIYMEVKRRPRFTVEKTTRMEPEERRDAG